MTQVVESNDILEFTVVDVGSNTLQGCLAYEKDNRTILHDIKGKKLIYNYENMRLCADELVEDIHWLYQHGAKEVQLVLWVPDRLKTIGSYTVRVPRHRARDTWSRRKHDSQRAA